jgi:hypothetical protein
MSCGMSKSGVGQRSKFLLLAHANVLGMSAKRASSCNLDRQNVDIFSGHAANLHGSVCGAPSI